jgi:hypothetical protein
VASAAASPGPGGSSANPAVTRADSTPTTLTAPTDNFRSHRRTKPDWFSPRQSMGTTPAPRTGPKIWAPRQWSRLKTGRHPTNPPCPAETGPSETRHDLRTEHLDGISRPRS